MQVQVLILQGRQDSLDVVVQGHTYTKLLPQVELKISAQAGNDLPVFCDGIVARYIHSFVMANLNFVVN